MATNKGFTAPVLAPDLLARQLRLQQTQDYGRRMLEEGGQMPQGQMVGGQFVAPSITQYLAQGLKSYLGREAENSIPQQYADLSNAQREADMQKFGLGASPQALAAGLSGESQMPLLFPGDPQRSMMAYQAMGPEGYFKASADNYKLTNEQRNLSHLSPEARNQLISAPFLNEAGKDGVQMRMGNDGSVQAFPVPGYRDIQAGNEAAITGARESASAPYTLVDVPDGQGGTRKMPLDMAASALREGPVESQAPMAGGQAGGGGMGYRPSEATVEARESLPRVLEQADAMIQSIDGLANHPGLSSAVGMRVPGWSYVPGTEAANFASRLDQLQGQAFLQAFESLKGGGQITEVEGKKATDAIARLSQNQSEAAFKESMRELREVLVSAKNRAYRKANMTAPGNEGSRGPDGDRMQQLDQMLGL
ncbi:hypothetical protein [Bordetella bronchiseptica]|uniref:hypothetical protein n=1 Tax=Bordetella bronchiseptica TaxID=518 RepID=UPI0011C07D8C|nr:hypothetical protein [Bordetella bronchiseptica]